MRIRVAEHVECSVKINVCIILVVEAKGKDGLENTGMKERIIFKLILEKYDYGHVMIIRGRTRTRLFCCTNVLEFLSPIN
jgi:hypothetical protein